MADGAVVSATSDDTVPQRGDRPRQARTPDGERPWQDPAGAEVGAAPVRSTSTARGAR